MLGRSKEELAWSLLAAGAAAGAAMAARKGLEVGWQAVRQTEPPDNPVKRGVGWGNALLWGAAIGVAGGLSRIIGRRGAAFAWKRTRGRLPAG